MARTAHKVVGVPAMRVSACDAMVPAMSASPATSHAIYLVECYAPAAGEEAVAVAEAASQACEGMRAFGADVRYLGALVVPDDEVGFHLFAARDVSGVLEATRRAALRVERVVDALAVAVEGDGTVADAPGKIGP
jgi:hypothetical protein